MPEDDNHTILENRVEELTNEMQHQKLMTSHFKRIFESIPDGVLCTDAESRIIMVNPAMEALFGFREKEIVGR